MSKRLVAISGGIGCGKSVIAAILRKVGYPVYDCDDRAKRLMDNDSAILTRLAVEIDREVVVDGVIDRKRLSEIVFADTAKLDRLNEIVHGVVRSDIAAWVADADSDTLFVETAILYQSGLDRMVDEVWEVVAPHELRIERVMGRNGCTREEVVARIKAQDVEIERPHGKTFEIVNDGFIPILPQIESLLYNHTN